jgi:hypothetical protein
MKKFIRKMFLIIPLMLIAKCIDAQFYNDYNDAEAVMLQVDSDTFTETKLEGVVVALPNNSNQLYVRLNMPFSSIGIEETGDTIRSLLGFPIYLKIKTDPWQIQESLTSDKTFYTDGFLTLNRITKLVKVEYTTLPSPSSEDGGFNLNLTMGSVPAISILVFRG